MPVSQRVCLRSAPILGLAVSNPHGHECGEAKSCGLPSVSVEFPGACRAKRLRGQVTTPIRAILSVRAPCYAMQQMNLLVNRKAVYSLCERGQAGNALHKRRLSKDPMELFPRQIVQGRLASALRPWITSGSETLYDYHRS